MRKSLRIPMSVFALIVGLGVNAGGQSHAQAPTRHTAQGTTITQSWTSTGTALDVATTGQNDAIGTFQGQMADGTRFTDSATFIAYPLAANGCEAEFHHFTRTFATPADTYDYEAISVDCAVPGHAGQLHGSGTLVITGGTGRYKGAIGTGTFTNIGTVVPTKAGQPFEFTATYKGNVTITIAGQ